MPTTISKQDLSVYQEQLKEVQLIVETRLGLIVPLSEYLTNFFVFNRHLFKHELKRNHNIIESFLSDLQSKAIESNGERVYEYIDVSNDALDQIFLVENKKDFYNDLMLCIERTGTDIKFNPVSYDDKYNNTSNELFVTYYDCLIYIIKNYNVIKRLKDEYNQFKFKAFNTGFYNTLIKQAQLVSDKMEYKGNLYTIESLLAYIIIKAELKEKSTVFDNEFDLVLKKHTKIN